MSKELLLNSSGHLSVLGILKEALQIFPRNGKIMASIALFSILSNCLLYLDYYLSVEPSIFDLVMDTFQLRNKQPGSPDYQALVIALKKDVGVLLRNELIMVVASWVVSLLSMVATVYASAMIYSGKRITVKDLLAQIGRIWRGPAITMFYISLLSVGFNVFIVIIFVLLAIFTKDYHFAFLALALLMVLLVLAICLYLALIWMVGLVVSVLEDACYGVEALRKAAVLLVGRKVQGYVISLLVILVAMPISGFLGYATSYMKFPPLLKAALPFMLTIIMSLWSLYVAVVYTVLYFECKKLHGEEVNMEKGSGYRMFIDVPQGTAYLV